MWTVWRWTMPMVVVGWLGAEVARGAAATDGFPGAGPLTLDAAVVFALSNSPALRAAQARVKAAEGGAYQAARWTNPQLQMVIEDWGVSRSGGLSDARQTLGIQQTLPFPGKKPLDRRIGGAGVRQSEAEGRLLRVELVRDVRAAFFRVLATEQMVGLARELLRVAEDSATTATRRVDAGAAPYQEQLRAEILLETARSDLAGYERDRGTARQVLATLLGDVDLNGVAVSGRLIEEEDPALLAGEADSGLARHPSAELAGATLKRAELEDRRARIEPYPDLTVGVAGGRLGETDESILDLQFSVPLPILDRSRGRRQETGARVTEASFEYDGVRQALRREWRNARLRYTAALEQVRVYRDRVIPRALEALRLTREGFEQGKFEFIDLLDTQRTAAEARVEYQQRLLELSLAQTELEALVRPASATTPGNTPEGTHE